MQPPGRVHYLGNLQILRFIAAAMVLLSHLEHETIDGRIPRMTPAADPTHIAWASGVDVFFIVSGFIMYYLTADHFGSVAYAGEFLKRRFVRIAPLYWIFTTLMLVAIQLTPGQVHHLDSGPGRVISSYLFLPSTRADGAMVPVLAGGWSLNLEVMFYLAYAAALIAPRRAGLGVLVGVFACLAGLSSLPAHSLLSLRSWGQSIILEFPMGMALAHLFLRGSLRLSRGGQVVLAVAALCAMAGLDSLAWGRGVIPMGEQPPDWDRWVWGGVPALILAAAIMLGPTLKGALWRALASGGDASYALYLSHPFVLAIMSAAWVRLHLPTVGWLYLAATAPVCIAAAWAIHNRLEAPLLAFLRRRLEPTRAVVAA